MGYTLTIGLYAKREQLPDGAAGLYTRLLTRGTFRCGTLHGRYHDHDLGPTYLDFSEEQLHSLAREIILTDSEKKLLLEVPYELFSGEWVLLDLNVHGARHAAGRMLMLEGQLSLKFELSDLYPSFQDVMEEEGLPFVPDTELDLIGPEVLSMVQMKRKERVHRNAREMFFLACGLTEGIPTGATSVPCGGFDHAVMYSDNGYGSLVGSSAIFHRDSSEYARDFLRIYLEYNQGIHLPLTLAPDADLESLNATPPMFDDRWGIGVPGKLDSGYYPYEELEKPKTHAAIIKFLEGLNEHKVRQLAQLTNERIYEMLYEMVTSNAVPDVTVYDFGDCGVAVFTGPLSNLWRVYKYIANRSTEGTNA